MSLNSYIKEPLEHVRKLMYRRKPSSQPQKPNHGCMRNRFFICLATLAIATALSACSTTHVTKVETESLNEHANLTKVNSKRLDLILVDQDRPWKNYQKIYVEVNSVNFDKRWLRDFRGRVLSNYVTRIQNDYAKLLKETLEKNLQEQGKFVVVQEPGEDVITLSSDITDLIIRGPETVERSKIFADSAGIATIYSELTSNESKLAVFKDREETRDRGFTRPVRTSRSFNYIDFKDLMEHWAERITENLG